MDGLSSNTMARQNLLERLLNSVKQVQVYFGASQEIATESDARVSALCVEWEMVLTHAARKPKPKNSLRLTGKAEEDLQRFYRLNHVKSELGRGRAWLRGAINERTLENYMHTIVCQEEELRKLYEAEAFLLDQERSSMLPIMAAGLSSIIFSICTDASYLNTPSRSVEVPESPPPAAFAPRVEVPHTQQPLLDQQRHHPSTHQHSSLPFPRPAEMMNSTQTPFPAHQDSFPGTAEMNAKAFLHVEDADDDVIAVRAKGKKKKRKSKSRSPHLPSERVECENSVIPPAASLEGDKVPAPLKESASSSSSRLSLDSVNDDGQVPLYVALTTPTDLVSGEARAAATATALVLTASSAPLSRDHCLPAPLSSDQHPPALVSSDRHSPVPVSSDQHPPALVSSDQHSPALLSSDRHSPVPVSSDQHPPALVSSDRHSPALLSSDRHSPVPVSSDQHSPALLSSNRHSPVPVSSDHISPAPLSSKQHMFNQHSPSANVNELNRQQVSSADESRRSQSPDGNMRTAMLSLSKMKDTLEVQNRQLLECVSELEVKERLLEQELEKNLQAMDDEREAHSSQKLGLERENDLLREQLKKYVSIVQAQRRDSPSADSGMLSEVPGSSKNTLSTVETPTMSTDNTVTTADKKLQEMAEMYADLMELNERLHRNLADKDVTVCSLVRLLREASIEVPLAQHELPAAAMETRVRLVEVWIPSVIRKGRGPDGFHVYQVFVSVKGVEWNVYRRYTEFRDFHRQLQKPVPQVATFNFPPKKAIGNKSTQVVEERRRRLQEYLRFVIKTCSSVSSSGNQSQPIINRSISKEVLVTIFPFFKEDFNQDPSPVAPSYSGL